MGVLNVGPTISISDRIFKFATQTKIDGSLVIFLGNTNKPNKQSVMRDFIIVVTLPDDICAVPFVSTTKRYGTLHS